MLLLQIAGMGEALGIEFYLFCFTDLFGVLRSKLVPASAVRSIATGGESAGNSAAAPELEIYLPDRLRAGQAPASRASPPTWTCRPPTA